jgi:serine protease Do
MSQLSQFSDELESLVANAAPSVVAVEHGHGQGSGIIVSGDGYVVTNAHVVQGRAGTLSVRLAGGEELSADIVGEDRSSDLAVLRVGAWNLPSLALDESRRLRVGQLVLAIGNPLRFERSVKTALFSVDDLQRVLVLSRGAEVELRLVRDGQPLSLSVKPELKHDKAA